MPKRVLFNKFILYDITGKGAFVWENLLHRIKKGYKLAKYVKVRTEYINHW